MYYFTHPQAYHMRPIDPLLVIMGAYAIRRLQVRVGMGAEPVVVPTPVAAGAQQLA